MRSNNLWSVRAGNSKRRLIALFVLVVGCAGAFSSISSAQPPANAIDVELECRARGDEVSLDITLRNAGTADTAVVLGKILANGAKYLADNLALEVKTGTDIVKYQYGDPSVRALPGASILGWSRSRLLPSTR
ncbi:MAG TPA: hypothetical protein VGO61_07155 [Steroidobacteraceae bacterium]|jgi:hypothetical protein|nr:hypothetical protein [Steroidobacteraceae bacterium]